MLVSRRDALTLLSSTLALGALAASTGATISNAATRKLQNGVDVSWLPQLELAGAKYFDANGRALDAFDLLKNTGIKIARIRLFVGADTMNGRLDQVQILAARAQQAGLQVCLDMHLSDTWADPGHQSTPNGWSTSNVDNLANAVSSYVYGILSDLKQRQIAIDFVQLGNEISNGMLWPLGSITSDTSAAWNNLAKLYNAAAVSLRKVYPNATNVLHLDCGGDAAKTSWWLARAAAHGITDFDSVGLSFYPQWSGDLAALQRTLRVVAVDFAKPVFVAETAYAWVNQSYGNDVIDAKKNALAGFEATETGQAAYVTAIKNLLLALPANRGMGVWWWEGLATSIHQPGREIFNPGMANSALVDLNGRALAALATLGS
jgi:arabinogalactan endo-1,4-beta-galactosidase